MTSPARSASDVTRFGAEAGYPILLKASAGGGGKGMRAVASEGEVAAAFERTSSEAKMYFGDAAVYAEKRIERPRHVEVQVVGDAHGNVVAVGERECSVQRRHQKLLEESPSPAVTVSAPARLRAGPVRYVWRELHTWQRICFGSVPTMATML